MPFLRTAVRRIAGLVRTRRREAELEAELESHLQLHIDDAVRAGMTPAEARRAALLKFGSLESAKEAYRDQRGIPPIEDVARDVRLAVRNLRRNPAFAAVAIATVALGIGATTTIFSAIDGILLRPLPFDGSERLVWATGKFPGGDAAGVSPPDFRDYRESAQTFDQFAAKAGVDGTSNVSGGDKPELVRSTAVSWNFFDALGVRPAVGRGFTQADERLELPRVAILGHAIWIRDFAGDPGVVGRKVRIDGQAIEIVGVLPVDLPAISRAEIWQPLPMLNTGMNQRSAHFLYVLGRLKPGVPIATARADLSVVARRLAAAYPTTDAGWSLNVVSLAESIVGSVRPALLLVFGAVGVLLLIACANVANLLLARGAVRRKEMAVRRALGAGRGRLVRQLLTENLVLAAIGGGLGVLVGAFGVAWLRRFAPADLPRLESVAINPAVLLFTIAVTGATGVIFGLLPSFSLSKGDALKEGGRSSGGAMRYRTGNALVVVQMAMSLLLLVVGALLLNSLWRLAHVDPGFRADGVVTARLSLPNARYPRSSQKAGFVSDLETRMRQVPGVQAIGTISELPLGGQYGDNPFTVDGRAYAPNALDDADSRQVSPGYFAAMRIPLLAGRWFDERDTARAQPVILVNQAFATRYFGDGHAIGRRLTLLGDPLNGREIVGIVGTVSHYALSEEPRPEMYLPLAQSSYGEMTVVVRTTGDAAAAAGELPRLVRSLDRDEAVADVRTMTDVVSASIAGSRFTALLVALFAGSALLLAGTGLHGLIAYTVAQRTRDIGIRIALGASPAVMRRAVFRQAAWLVLLAAGIGLTGAFGLARFVGHLLFGVTATDPATFALVTLLLGIVGLTAPYGPARRAMRVDPVVALRQE